MANSKDILRRHHSRSTLPEMATDTPWCNWCWRFLKKGTLFCPTCAEPASYSGEQSRTPQPPWQSTESWVNAASWADNAAWRGRSPSPRDRRGKDKNRAKGQEKGKGKGKDKGKGQGKPAGKGKGAPTGSATGAPDLTMLPMPPQIPTLPAPTTTSAATETTTSEAQSRLDALLSTLRSSREVLPADLVKMLGEVDAQDAQAEARLLHRAVSEQHTAKKELRKAQAAHRSYVRSWAAYVGQLTKTLSDQFTEQEKAMAVFSAAETRWSEKLQETTTALAKLSGGTQHIISDPEDMEVNEPKGKNHEAEDDPWKTEDAARDLRERQLELVKMIQQRHEQASASMSDSEASKREGSRTPRRREKDGADTTAHPGDAQT